MKKSTRAFCITATLMVGAYLILRWDYHLSSFRFDKLCNDPEKIGLFVYENVTLDGKYFEKIEGADREIRDHRYLLGGNSILIENEILRDYRIRFYDTNEISSAGPIFIVRSTVHRKSDGKLLGEAVSAASLKGWFAQVGSLSGAARVFCPSGQDDKGFPNYYRAHNELVRSIFRKNG